MTEKIAFDTIDIRKAVGHPYGSLPLKMTCPDHIHFARTKKHDDTQSMAVYRDHVYCYGCGFNIPLKYASLAFLLGKWDGVGEAWGAEAAVGVMKLQLELPKFVSGYKDADEAVGKDYVEPLDLYAPRTFHLYMMKYEYARMEDELMLKRGFSLETIEQYELGHTGQYFTIPVYGIDGELRTVRYRADTLYIDTPNKYKGIHGHNELMLYPLSAVAGMKHIPELWLVEGEYDAISVNQAGKTCLTVTNGAGNLCKMYEMVTELGITVDLWVLAGDQDGAGDAACGKLSEVLTTASQHWVRASWLEEYKDTTELLAAGYPIERVLYDSTNGE